MANPNNAFIARIIRVYALPAGSTVTAYNSPLTGAINLGEFSTDGLKWNRSRTTETISSNNSGVLRTITTDSEVTLGGTLLEDNEDVKFFLTGLRAVAGVITDDGRSSWTGSIVADEIDDARNDGSVKYIRTWIPAAETTATDERTASAASAKSSGFTATAYPSDLIGGGKYREFTHVVAGDTTTGTQGSTTTEPTTTEPAPIPTESITLNSFGPVSGNSSYTVTGTSTGRPDSSISIVIDSSYLDMDGNPIAGGDYNADAFTDSQGNFSYGPITVPAEVVQGSVTVTASFPMSTVSDTQTETIYGM